MNLVRSFPIVFSLIALGTSSWAAQHDGHTPHHPAGSTAAKAKPGSPSNPDMARMDTQMQAMQAMHDKMMAATTPEARNALMAEHMKTMQDGMGMMKSMGMGGGKGAMSDPKAKPADMTHRQQMMEQRLDMMQTMMEMMVDRLPPSPAKP